jgi:hypothetical protein
MAERTIVLPPAWNPRRIIFVSRSIPRTWPRLISCFLPFGLTGISRSINRWIASGRITSLGASFPDGRHRAVSSRELDAVPAPPQRPRCDHRAFTRMTDCKPFLTIWVANAPALSGEEARRRF